MEAASWIAAQVVANRELSVSFSLNSKGYTTFVPTYKSKRQWSDRTKIIANALLPGYVLVQHTSEIVQGPIVTTPGVIGIVGFANRPALIDDTEISPFRTLMNSSIKAEPWPRFQQGDRVTIAMGPLAGIAGTVLQTRNKSLMIIAITILNRFVSVHIEKAWLQQSQPNTPSLQNAS